MVALAAEEKDFNEKKGNMYRFNNFPLPNDP
jgi:hypothetical protein